MLPAARLFSEVESRWERRGVQSGWVVQSLNGMNVQNEEQGSGNEGKIGEDE